MKNLFIFVVFMIFSVFGNTQTGKIESIREQYSFAQQEISGQKNEDLPENNMHIVINQMMPAIGSQTVEYYFYFQLKEPDDDVSFLHDLFFVTRKYNVAESSEIYEEFLFDLSGNLIFYFQNAREEKCKQIRCYFSDNKLIKVLYKEADLNEDEECPASSKYKLVLQSKNKLPEDYALEYIQATAKNIASFFNLIDKN